MDIVVDQTVCVQGINVIFKTHKNNVCTFHLVIVLYFAQHILYVIF